MPYYIVSSTPPPLPSFVGDAEMSDTTSREQSAGVDDKSGESSEDESSTGISACQFYSLIAHSFVYTESNEIWEDDVNDGEFHSESSSEVPSFDGSPDNQKAHSLRRWLVGFLLCLQSKFYISDACLINFLHVFLAVMGKFSPIVAVIAQQFPKSLYNARKSLGVEVTYTRYVSCPKCFKLYLYKKSMQKKAHTSIVTAAIMYTSLITHSTLGAKNVAQFFLKMWSYHLVVNYSIHTRCFAMHL